MFGSGLVVRPSGTLCSLDESWKNGLKSGRAPVAVRSNYVNESIKLSVRVRLELPHLLITLLETLVLLAQTFVMLSHLPARSPAGFYHQFQYALVPVEPVFIAISPMFTKTQPVFSSTVRIEQLVDRNRVLCLLLNNEIHRTLSLVVSHRWKLV